MLFTQVTADDPTHRKYQAMRSIRGFRCCGGVMRRRDRMAVDGRINVRHEDVFTPPVLLLSVDPLEHFDKKRAGDGRPGSLQSCAESLERMRAGGSGRVYDRFGRHPIGRRLVGAAAQADVFVVGVPAGRTSPASTQNGFRGTV
jgi:hypothetical protein